MGRAYGKTQQTGRFHDGSTTVPDGSMPQNAIRRTVPRRFHDGSGRFHVPNYSKTDGSTTVPGRFLWENYIFISRFWDCFHDGANQDFQSSCSNFQGFDALFCNVSAHMASQVIPQFLLHLQKNGIFELPLWFPSCLIQTGGKYRVELPDWNGVAKSCFQRFEA